MAWLTDKSVYLVLTLCLFLAISALLLKSEVHYRVVIDSSTQSPVNPEILLSSCLHKAGADFQQRSSLLDGCSLKGLITDCARSNNPVSRAVLEKLDREYQEARKDCHKKFPISQ